MSDKTDSSFKMLTKENGGHFIIIIMTGQRIWKL